MILNEDKQIIPRTRKATLGGKQVLDTIDTGEWSVISELMELDKVSEDSKSYDFDYENLDFHSRGTTKNGVDYLMFEAGGDWELPLRFFIYYDGKDLRCYVPAHGNMVNTLNGAAFGNGEDLPVNGMDGDDAYCLKYGIVVQNGDLYEALEPFIDDTACIEEFESVLDVDIDAVPNPFDMGEWMREVEERRENERLENQPATAGGCITIRPQIEHRIPYWSVIKFKGHWLIVITDDPNVWCVDGGYTYAALSEISEKVMSKDTATFQDAKIGVVPGAGEVRLRDGSEISDDTAGWISRGISDILADWVWFDAEPLIESRWNEEKKQ